MNFNGDTEYSGYEYIGIGIRIVEEEARAVSNVCYEDSDRTLFEESSEYRTHTVRSDATCESRRFCKYSIKYVLR